MELVTTHTHTCFTNHGEGTVEELVSAAAAAGITTIAVTEHYPLTDAFDARHYLAMDAGRTGEYLAAIEAARAAHPEIEVIAGCELDWLGDDEDRDLSPEDFEPFGLVLGSVHFVDRWPFDDPAQRGRWDEVGADAIWRRYFEVWCEAAASDGPFQVMSHPDLAKKFNFYPSFDPRPLYEEAAEAVASAGRMVEVNTSGSYYACKEMFPAPALLEAFCRAGVPCTVGTDAHKPEHVARDIEEGYRLMARAGYRTVTVPTADGGRREIIIDL
ncbi:histidinol-phosphatase HisJ family protein [Arabiibacter massiliensis]|uniref:histidinol-phosphatase HisJ family protein n=1 Tax=Arabiibacter massiliensis TaxID=1870985 RepID=UPI0009BBFDF5|nr:histidinol-phosphatase HisJ family protein [Arabiibacter massiliensis]